jgi:hypothetical protein
MRFPKKVKSALKVRIFIFLAVENVADELSTVETFQGRLTWLDLNFSESGDAKEIIKAFNKSFLSNPETVIQGTE